MWLSDHEQTNAVGDVSGAVTNQCDRKRQLQLPRRERTQTWSNQRLPIRLRTRPRSVPPNTVCHCTYFISYGLYVCVRLYVGVCKCVYHVYRRKRPKKRGM